MLGHFVISVSSEIKIEKQNAWTHTVLVQANYKSDVSFDCLSTENRTSQFSFFRKHFVLKQKILHFSPRKQKKTKILSMDRQITVGFLLREEMGERSAQEEERHDGGWFLGRGLNVRNGPSGTQSIVSVSAVGRPSPAPMPAPPHPRRSGCIQYMRCCSLLPSCLITSFFLLASLPCRSSLYLSS